MTNQLPCPITFKEAVSEVIERNKRVGYIPSRFISAAQGGYADKLVQICATLIHRDTAIEALQKAISGYPDILTLEDLTIRSEYGREGSFDEQSVRRTEATVQLLDQQLGCQRWR